MINTITRVFRYLLIGLGIQQVLYGIYYDSWIDFTEFSGTTLFFEFLYIGYLILSGISDSAIEPMNFRKKTKICENYFIPKK
jgi:hypothetical protein